jgi:hypothetical protein
VFGSFTSCSAGSSGSVYCDCRTAGVVFGPGIAAVAVEYILLLTPTAKWLQPGQTLPATVDRDHPERPIVRWDDMPRNRDLGRKLAHSEAAKLAASMAPTSAPVPDPPVTALLGDADRPIPGAEGFTPEQAAAALAGDQGSLQPARARVLAVYEISVPSTMPRAAPGGIVDLTLDVTPASGLGYSTRMRIGFSTPQKRATIAAVGWDLPVLVDPAHPDKVVVDTARLG